MRALMAAVGTRGDADATLAPVPATLGRRIFQTGTWVLADTTPLPADLEAFIGSGEPPIFVGFGSMPAAGDVTRRLIGAARAVDRRIIVSRGWADLDVVDDARDCMAVRDVSHDVLFARVAAIVHHGGAGTTAAAARAGVPQVITPMFGDQFYWASRIVDLGVGATTPHATMTEESLTDALRQVFDLAVVGRARSLAANIPTLQRGAVGFILLDRGDEDRGRYAARHGPGGLRTSRCTATEYTGKSEQPHHPSHNR